MSVAAPKILIKMPNWVGDCVMATPAIAALRRTFPDAQIDALARRGVTGVLLDNPDLSQVIVADDRKLNRDEWRRLKLACFDAAILFPNSLRSAWTMRRLGIWRRIGYARPALRRLLLTRAVHYNPILWQTTTPFPLSPKSIKGPQACRTLGEYPGIVLELPLGEMLTSKRPSIPGHMVSYYYNLALMSADTIDRNAGFRSGDALDDGSLALVLPVNSTAAEQVKRLLEEHRLAGATLIGLNPGAAYGTAKRYPLTQLASAANRVVAEFATHSPPPALISTAAPNESHLNDELASTLAAPLHRLGENLDLRGLTALIDRLSLLITNDSGAMHIAAAGHTPTVAIFGPTDWNVTRPWNPNARVIRNSPACAPCFLRTCPIDHRCMTTISPESVASAALELVQLNRARQS